MIPCAVTGMSQELDFETNTMVTYLVLRLADGVSFRATVDEETAAAVMAAQINVRGEPRVKNPAAAKSPLAPPPAYAPAADTEEDDEPEDAPEDTPELPVTGPVGDSVHHFGDDDDAPVTDADKAAMIAAVNRAAAEAAAATSTPATSVRGPAPPAGKLEKKKETQREKRRRSEGTFRTVPKDDHGYPMPIPGGVDPDSVTGDTDRDETGVGSA